jgi:threonyl-tRNA synthetase
VELDLSNLTLNKKIRNHQLEQWNFILVAGEEEVS